MDIDWAPDFVVETILTWFFENSLPLTVFTTHFSTSLQALHVKYPHLLEIGIHPNFSKGFDPSAVASLREAHPTAIGSRSHRNISGRNVSDILKPHGILYDSSQILWKSPYLQVTPTYNGIFNIPYIWEDGYHLEMNAPLNQGELPLNTPGLKILNFHPLLLYLNCISDETRKKAVRGITDLTKVTQDYLDPFVHNNYGIWDFSKEFLLALKAEGKGFYRLGDIARILGAKFGVI
jgi:hypothetical protein